MKFYGKILIVDDEPHIRKFFGMILQELGTMTIFEAGNGIEAVALYAQHHPKLVLMDINMPGMDGLDALRELQRLDHDVRVVMLTSVATRKAVEQAVDLGAVYFVRKDTSREKITGMLSDILRTGHVTPEVQPIAHDRLPKEQISKGS